MRLAAFFRTVAAVGYDLFLKLNPRKVAAHAVICDEAGRVLVLKSRYAEALLLPGGGLKAGEHLTKGCAASAGKSWVRRSRWRP